MSSHKFLLLTSAGLAALLLATAVQAENGVALTGKVASAQEPVMEGVLVSARLDGSNITTTVATDAQGIYSFPAARLAPGHYTISIRAVGRSNHRGHHACQDQRTRQSAL
jgi:virginiamycin B lyase